MSGACVDESETIVGAKSSLYMLQFKMTSLLENLLAFHLERLLQVHKPSMSYSTVDQKV